VKTALAPDLLLASYEELWAWAKPALVFGDN